MPHVYKLEVGFTATHDGGNVDDRRKINFGMRELGVKGTQFTINGKTIFLRGNHPKTRWPCFSRLYTGKVASIMKSGFNNTMFR